MTDAGGTPVTVKSTIVELGKVLQRLDRNDLVDRATAAARPTATAPSTVVCVVGEFKQGKSSLVNALLGQRRLPGRRRPRHLCHHARAPRRRARGAVVRRREGGRSWSSAIAGRATLHQLGDRGGQPGQRAAGSSGST